MKKKIIEIGLKIPEVMLYIKGDLENDLEFRSKIGELFLKDSHAFMAEAEEGGMVVIPSSNISYMKNVKED